MKRLLLFIYLTLAACIANAELFEVNILESQDFNLEIKILDTGIQAQAIEDCMGCRADVSLAPQPIATLAETGAHLNRMNVKEGWQNACSEFVQDGEIGYYGEMIRSEMTKSGYYTNIKNGDKDLAALCPNYPMMNDSSKANVFLLILTSMAFEESTCNNDKSRRGPYGIAKGFFQLHLGKEASYSPDCNNFDSRTPSGSIACTLSILDKQMSDGNLFRQEANYWDVLRPKRWDKKRKKYFSNPSYAQIREAIAEFAPCYERQSLAPAAEANVNRQLFQLMDKKIFHKPEVIEINL